MEERAEVYKLGVRAGPATTQRPATIGKWQEIWDKHKTTAQWTKKLIPNIAKWLECTHRRADYTLTQFLAGYETYGAYTKRIGKKEDSSCTYCHEAEDRAEHTFFECEKWERWRTEIELDLNINITPGNVITKMIESPRNWKLIENYRARVIKQKERDERDDTERI